MIFSNVSPLEDYKNAIETAINVIQNNLSKLGLELEPKETVLIHFNNKNIAPEETKIFIRNCVQKLRSIHNRLWQLHILSSQQEIFEKIRTNSIRSYKIGPGL